jgi:single-stranded-DNA-specific exonuclease
MLLGQTEEEDWPARREDLNLARIFLRSLRGQRVLVASHSDANGLSASALMMRALEGLGARANIQVLDKGEHARSPAFQTRLGRVGVEALVMLDLGRRHAPLLPGVRTLVVDPHPPDSLAPGAQVLSSAGHEPVACVSLLTYWLVAPFIEPADLEWLAVLGTVGNLGVDAPIPFLKEALKRAGRKAVMETLALLKMARHSPHFAADLTLDVLLSADTPTDIQYGLVPGVEALRDCRHEVLLEVDRCARTPPLIVKDVALLLFSSGAQVHPLVAILQAQRLPGHLVIAANVGYRPGRVCFTCRGKPSLDLGAWCATRGCLAPENFLRLTHALGLQGLQPGDIGPTAPPA